ncbi:MAG: hypothetical protein ACTHMS_17325 [Jatrophihabitans sp.]|uniref:hypothetical protein n=1 Tax=Jatrophihabitans sp. TaxID=1932789 RepID=UPI003F813520
MAVATLVLVLVDIAVLALLARKLLGLDKEQRALRAELAELSPVDSLPPALEKAFAGGRKRLLTVEILNPLELATAQHKLAGVAGSFAPATVRSIVYDQAAKITREQLAKHQVQADVQVHVTG